MSRRGGKKRTKPNPYNSNFPALNGMYWQSQTYNQRLVNMYRNTIVQMAMSRFKWINLPPHCDARFLEWTLLYEGVATIAFPRNREGEFYSTRATFDSKPNVYDNYTKWRSTGNNNWNFYCNHNNGVLVWDNNTRYPLMNGIMIKAQELAHIQLTKEMNRFHQQIPWILKGPQSKKQDLISITKQVAGGEQAIIALDSFGDIEVDALMTNVPFIGNELAQDEKNAWNGVYQLLGIENSTLKMERQTQDEIDAQRQPTTMVALASISERRKAADYLNEHFGQYLMAPIEVVWNNDLISRNYNFLHNDQAMMEVM